VRRGVPAGCPCLTGAGPVIVENAKGKVIHMCDVGKSKTEYKEYTFCYAVIG
jgi:hypothetical protein